MTSVTRKTRETTITVALSRDDLTVSVDTPRPFLNHMLETFARYAGLGVRLQAGGDLPHHIIEDVAIALGTAVAEMTTPTATRYAERTIPMDDALVQCVLDLGGRPYYRGALPSRMYEHWMRSFADNAKATIHMRVLRGKDKHHVVEAAFKALGFSVRDALREADGVVSTKGAVALTVAG